MHYIVRLLSRWLTSNNKKKEYITLHSNLDLACAKTQIAWITEQQAGQNNLPILAFKRLKIKIKLLSSEILIFWTVEYPCACVNIQRICNITRLLRALEPFEIATSSFRTINSQQFWDCIVILSMYWLKDFNAFIRVTAGTGRNRRDRTCRMGAPGLGAARLVIVGGNSSRRFAWRQIKVQLLKSPNSVEYSD